MITFVPARRLDVIDDLTRRRFIGGSLSLAALMAACGGEPGSAPPPGTTPAGSGFPVTVEHRYGSTTIPAEPPAPKVTRSISSWSPASGQT